MNKQNKIHFSTILLGINNLRRQTTDHHLRLSISHPNHTEIITQINRISLSDYNYKVLYQNSRTRQSE